MFRNLLSITRAPSTAAHGTATRFIAAVAAAALIVPWSATALSAEVTAQSAPASISPAATTAAIAAPAVLEPFVAQYQVFNGGSALGEATLQLVRQPPGRWRVDLLMRGTGLFRIAGLHADQSTVFDTSPSGQTYRPLTQATVRKTAFTRKQTVGLYDWRSRNARWSGDVKESRTRPVALTDGDMSGLLINLAVIRDAIPGKALHYRFVDDGRVRDHHYAVATAVEGMSAGDMRFDTMRVTRRQGGDETVLWVASGVPTPIRILQRENGKDTYDLRLIEYTGIP